MKNIIRFLKRQKYKLIELFNFNYKLKIDTLKGWHWCDRDRLLFESSFQILIDYIEKEKPEERIDWDSDERHQEAWRKIKGLYNWYKLERPLRQDPYDDKNLIHPTHQFSKIEGSDLLSFTFVHESEWAETMWKEALYKSHDMQEAWYNEDTEKMKELADVRSFLWT